MSPNGNVCYRLLMAACLLAISGISWASEEHAHRHGHGLTTTTISQDVNGQQSGSGESLGPLMANASASASASGRQQRRPHRTAGRLRSAHSRRADEQRADRLRDPAAYQTISDAAGEGPASGREAISRSEISRSRAQIPALNGSSHSADQTPFQQLMAAMKLADSHNHTSTKAEQILKSSKDALLVTKRQYLRTDWCKSQPLIQRVTEDGCLSATVLNQFCYGQCNSFFIPKNVRPSVQRSASADPAFRSCAFCKPKRTTWISVTLKCPSLVPPVRRRRVQIIKQCRCITEILS